MCNNVFIIIIIIPVEAKVWFCSSLFGFLYCMSVSNW